MGSIVLFVQFFIQYGIVFVVLDTAAVVCGGGFGQLCPRTHAHNSQSFLATVANIFGEGKWGMNYLLNRPISTHNNSRF